MCVGRGVALSGPHHHPPRAPPRRRRHHADLHQTLAGSTSSHPPRRACHSTSTAPGGAGCTTKAYIAATGAHLTPGPGQPATARARAVARRSTQRRLCHRDPLMRHAGRLGSLSTDLIAHTGGAGCYLRRRHHPSLRPSPGERVATSTLTPVRWHEIVFVLGPLLLETATGSMDRQSCLRRIGVEKCVQFRTGYAIAHE